jgi:hypothetical protein
MAPNASEAIYTHAFARLAIAVTIDATIYTAYRVFATRAKVTFIASALTRLFRANAPLTTVVRAVLFATICTFPQVVAVALCFHAHPMPRAIVQAVITATGMPSSAGGALTVSILAATSDAATFLAFLIFRARRFRAVFAKERRVANAVGIFIADSVATAPFRARGLATIDSNEPFRARALTSGFVAFSILPVAVVRA